MDNTIHITSGDSAGESLAKSGLPGGVFVWRDVLYDGPRCPGWPDENTFNSRAAFLERGTGGALDRHGILQMLRGQYRRLDDAAGEHIVLWFDACLFDQSMLAHILTCLRSRNATGVELICVDSFPGIEPFHGLGQLRPEQLASLYDKREPVSDPQFRFARKVDTAFVTQDAGVLTELSRETNPPLPWIPAAAARWLQERPDPATGLGRVETLALEAIRAGCDTPEKIFAWVAARETPPQYWGDTTLWEKINALAEHDPPLVKINGPAQRLPQWESDVSLGDFRIEALPSTRSSFSTT